MSSGHGFDFFGFEWWYSFNKKTFRSFTFLLERKKSDFFFKKKEKKRSRRVAFFPFFVTDERLLSVEKTKSCTTWNAYSRNRSRSFFVDCKTSIVDSFSGSSVAFSHSSYCFVFVSELEWCQFSTRARKDFNWKKAIVNHLLKWKVKINFYLVVPG